MIGSTVDPARLGDPLAAVDAPPHGVAIQTASARLGHRDHPVARREVPSDQLVAHTSLDAANDVGVPSDTPVAP